MALAVSLPSHSSEAELLVVELRWPGGSRHLHYLPPKLTASNLTFSNLVATPLEAPPSTAIPRAASSDSPTSRAVTARLAASLIAPTLPLSLPTSPIDRGIGIEIEYITASGPGRPDAITRPNPAIGAILDALVQELEEEGEGEGGWDLPEDARSALAGCQLWDAGEDGSICATAEAAASRIVEECSSQVQDIPLALELLRATPRRTDRTEFRSPAPPNELSFSDEAADEIRAFAQLLQRAGAAATSLCRTHSRLVPAGTTFDAASHFHVHVNVRNPKAAGELLTARQLANIALAWIRFDLVTLRLCRAWMWREPSAAPLFATGPEFTRAHKAEKGGADLEWDVPAFYAALHAVLGGGDDNATAAFDALDDAEQVARVFGPKGKGSPVEGLGRYCSLNLQSVDKLGTLEFRRFHGTLDGDLMVHWAYFCVAFVEAHKDGEQEANMLAAATSRAGLEALQVAQERATVGELMENMKGLLDPRTAAVLEADAMGRECVQ